MPIKKTAFPLLICAIVALCSICAYGDGEWSLKTFLETVPPLKHDAAGRLPMIVWIPFRPSNSDNSFDRNQPLPVETYRQIARRGLTQAIRLKPEHLEMALAIQQAGAQVIVMDAMGRNSPYTAADDPFHKLAEEDRVEGQEVYPCALVRDGWEITADRIRATLGKFKQAGVDVKAVWLDWEVEPKPGKKRWQQAKNCSRCRKMFAPAILASPDAYGMAIGFLKWELQRQYVAKPILEIYPDCSTTNWLAAFSSYETPTQAHWAHRAINSPPDIGGFTAANPVVYGGDPIYNFHWKEQWGWPLDVPHMDRVYTFALFCGISQNAANQQYLAPQKQCVPWVCRYLPENRNSKVPILSRKRYREILRHVWLRGADSMQIFNPLWDSRELDCPPDIATQEVHDAVIVYDQMLAYREFLDDGLVMNTEVPGVQYDGPIWSGLRLENQAVVRAFTQGPDPVKFEISPWEPGGPGGPGASIQLEATPDGITYRLYRQEDGSIKSVPQKEGGQE